MAEAYASDAEHLRDELARVEQFVRAEFVRWQSQSAARKDRRLWGASFVGTAELDNFLAAPFEPSEEWPEPAEAAPYAEIARQNACEINDRLQATGTWESLRLPQLAAMFGLDEIDREILLVCLLPEFDPRYRRLFGFLMDDVSRSRPTCELVWRILRRRMPTPEEAMHRLSASGVLASGLLVAIEGPPAESHWTRSIVIEERIAAYLLGSDAPDRRLRECTRLNRNLYRWENLPVEPRVRRRLESCAFWVAQRPAERAVFLHGESGAGQIEAAYAIATQLQRPSVQIDAAAALRAPVAFSDIVRLIYREARLQGAVVCWEGADRIWQADTGEALWSGLLSAAAGSGPSFFCSAEIWEPKGTARNLDIQRIHFPVPAASLRVQIWTALLGGEDLADGEKPAAEISALLAPAFQLTQSQIVDARAGARLLAMERDPERCALRLAELQEACRRQAGRRLLGLAQRIEPSNECRLDQLVLPPANLRQVTDLRDRVRVQHELGSLGLDGRHRCGVGLVALFSGASGTGKTMTAELLAADRGVDLYKVDVSQVVSKWVGETEKNLERVFLEAEHSNSFLFFDEADSLFGRRGRIENAQDRWGSLQVNFLLQRIERYPGVVVLATNLKENLDEAFLRRIHVLVDFPFPDADARGRIWNQLLPEGGHVLTGAEIRTLAQRFSLCGGSIRNIVVDAAVRALAAGQRRIELRHVIASLARESQKLGKPITRADFGPVGFAWATEDIVAPAPPTEQLRPV